MKQRIGFLYLKTGGGHISGAKALVHHIEDGYSDDIECFLENGFKKSNWISRLFFEKGYALTSNYFESGYITFYQFTKSEAVLNAAQFLFRPFFIKKLVHFLKTKKITKVVCVHEILIPLTRTAINRVDPSIPLISIVLDPFTAHPIWFYEKNTELIVFSRKLQQEAVAHYGFSENNVHLFPPMLSKKFDTEYSNEEKTNLKKRMGFLTQEKILLIAGGGEGLKTAPELVKEFIRQELPYRLIVVCGKNKILKRHLTSIAANHTDTVTIYGFVDFMPDLINIADCVITKGGPATVIETLKTNTPLIISSYIRGQELGNMLYVVQNKAGWFLRQPEKAVQKADEILKNEHLQADLQNRIAALNITNGLDAICRFIAQK